MKKEASEAIEEIKSLLEDYARCGTKILFNFRASAVGYHLWY